MAFEKERAQLAKAAVYCGVQLQKNQIVIIRSPIELADLAREVAKTAWKAGAKDVQVIYSDDELSRQFYTHADIETAKNPPKWMVERLEEAAKEGACFITLDGDDPDAFIGIDPQKMTARTLAMSNRAKAYRKGIDTGTLAWTIIAAPTRAWAKKVYPEFDEEKAYQQLWNDMMDVCRAHGDVIENWKEHSKDLHKKADRLNALHLRRMHYTSANGTDLWVDLPDRIEFAGGSTRLQDGREINCNIPTEELFTTPSRTGVNGTLEAVMPLIYHGQKIDGFGFTFKDGEVIEFHAKEGYDALKALLESDPNAKRLGELALVDKNTPIRKLGRIFYSTLIDENAACHFAFGQSYAETLPGGNDMDAEALEELGMNQSKTHVDFMVGADDLRIEGFNDKGVCIPIFDNGSFVDAFTKD